MTRNRALNELRRRRVRGAESDNALAEIVDQTAMPEQQEATEQRAIRLVTASDVVPIRLGASPGMPPETHGTYRAKTGTDVAVLTASSLPAPEAGERPVAWVRHGERWFLLGRVERIDEPGRWLLIIRSQAVASPVDEVRVTRERKVGDAPLGPTLLEWVAGHERQLGPPDAPPERRP